MGFGDLKLAANRLAGRAANHVLPFYRRYPYHGTMPFFKVDPRGGYSPLEPFFFNRVPKAGSSSINLTLAKLSDYERPFKGDKPRGQFLRPMHMTPKMVRQMERDAFKFTMVRDPYTRALSAFNDKILGTQVPAYIFRDWFQKPGVTPTFADFCRYLDEGHIWADMHWAPQSDFLLLPLDEFDFVGRLENIDEDLPYIVEQIFGKDAVDGVARAGKKTNTREKLEKAYGPKEVEIITRLYARDFDLLGYDRWDA